MQFQYIMCARPAVIQTVCGLVYNTDLIYCISRYVGNLAECTCDKGIDKAYLRHSVLFLLVLDITVLLKHVVTYITYQGHVSTRNISHNI